MKRFFGWFFAFFLCFPLLEVLVWRQLWKRRLSVNARTQQPRWSTGLLYLSGISDFTTVELMPNQLKLIEQVAARYKPDVSLRLTYPYEAETPKKWLPFDLWHKLGFKRTPVWGYALRNLWQGVISSWLPGWYGEPVAKLLRSRLGEANDNATLIVLGNSSGAAITLSATSYLRRYWPGLRVVTIMCGGVFGANPGFDEVAEFHQLVGVRDHIVKIAYALAPSLSSDANPYARARSQGRYTERVIGNQTHFGSQGYFSDAFFAQTSEEVMAILKTIEL